MVAHLLPTAFSVLGAIAGAVLAPPEQRTLRVYDCDNLSTIAVRGDRGGMEVSSPGIRLYLRSLDAAALRYSDGTTTLTMGDQIIRLEGAVGNLLCRTAPEEVPWVEARLRGIEVRAVGNDPGWILEIDEGMEMTFVADGGATRLSVPIAGSLVDHRNLTVSGFNDSHEIEAFFERKMCSDAKGATTSAAAVTVDGMLYRGCARILPSGVLAGTVTWPGAPLVPAGAELIVQIVGAEKSNAGRVLAESRSAVHGEGTLQIRLEYNRAAVFGADRYMVRARIDVGSRTRWISRSTPLVVTWGNIASVDLHLTAPR